ncbi:MAG TPA: type II toxin-antitoxin system RelE/ParE family toxin [Terriglobales bacterium]|nr:type II toxin-antitoxin system RelE/ParE family toxin [Terriglobales bacterium]
MEKYHLTPEAVSDLFEIWDYIAQDNPAAADRVREAVFRACDLLAESPLAGHIRADLTPLPVRFWSVRPYVKYLIVYDPEKKPLQIIRILHGARDLPSVLM